MQTTPLGDNAFVASEEIFLPVDVDGERKSLQQQGAANGKANSPRSDAVRPDDVEQGIIQKMAQTVQQTQEGLRKHFVGFHTRLLPIEGTRDAKALIDQIQAMPTEVKNSLNDILGRFESKSAIRGPKWRHAQADYDKFREDNNLLRTADYSSRKSIISWFSGLILVEAVLNATLLWELTGFLLALGQTALITAVNVLFLACLMGMCLRCINHVSLKVRPLALFCIPLFLAVLVFNFGVGHYRDALVEAKVQAEQLLVSPEWDGTSAESTDLGFVDYTQRAMEGITDSFLGINSILSALLIIVGLCFFGYATWKWYSVFDPYPGYRKRDLALKRAHENYKSLVDTTRAQMKEKDEDSRERVLDESTKVTNMRKLSNDLNNRADALKKGYATWSATLEQTQTTLLEIYRNSNRQARSEPSPEYFNDEIPIDRALIEPPDFKPPVLGDMDAVVKTVRLTEEKRNKIVADAWERFNTLANMKQQTDESGCCHDRN